MLWRSVLFFFFLAAFPARAEPLSLGLPIACSLGSDCWIQQYPAHGQAEGEGAQDYRCGHESYKAMTARISAFGTYLRAPV